MEPAAHAPEPPEEENEGVVGAFLAIALIVLVLAFMVVLVR